MDTDEGLIERIAKGDRLAMQALYSRHSVRIFRYLVRLVRSEALADDLIGDTFLDVWQQAGRFEGRSSVSTWLTGIARFKALSALRKRPHQSLDDEIAEQVVDDADDPETVEQKRDKSAVLRRCIDALSLDHREVIHLVYYNERALDEVAGLLGIPGNTVKTRLFHARKRLAEMAKTHGLDRGWP